MFLPALQYTFYSISHLLQEAFLVNIVQETLSFLFVLLSPKIAWHWTIFSFVVVQSLSPVQLFVTPWMPAHQTSLSFTISQSLFRFMSIESVMLSYHLILCHPLLLLPSVIATIRVFSIESALLILPKYWHFRISPSSEYSQIDFF